MKLMIRKAKNQEIGIAFNLLKEAAEWLKDKNINYWQNWLDPEDIHIKWIKEGFEKDQFSFVENDNNNIIGMFRLQYEDEYFWGKRDEKAGYIHSFTVIRNLSGKGIGYLILDKIKEFLKNKNINILRLDCGSDIKDLCNYYEKYGFKKVGTAEVYDDKLTLYELDI